MHLTHAEARAIMLAAQGLDRRPDQTATKASVLEAIRRMSALQIDTIHVVARSPYLVLWSRLGDYNPQWLDELLDEGAIFEYWSHEACFLPIEDYPFYRSFMLEGSARSWTYARDWIAANQDHVEQLLAHIRARGPVRSADCERTDGQKGTWWNWKQEKMVLEMLYTRGDLMIARRHNFQRIYDLRERVLPAWDDAHTPLLAETRRELALKAVRALGITTARWVADYFRTKSRATDPLLEALASEGLLVRATVEGWRETAYIHPDNLPLVEAIRSEARRPALTTLLSPFDPLVWDRARALSLFGFEYRIECYTPAPKRRYGYFTLPILHRGDLVGRLDPKAHRAEGRFEVKAIYLEPGIPLSDELVAGIAGALQACAAWHNTPNVTIARADPPELAELLTAMILG